MATKKAPTKFLDWLKTEMEKKGWGISETARRAGLTHTPLSYVVTNGEMPSFETCLALANAFNAPIENILRLANLLPETDVDIDDEDLQKIIDAYKHLSPEERGDIVAYVQMRYERASEKAQNNKRK